MFYKEFWASRYTKKVTSDSFHDVMMRIDWALSILWIWFFSLAEETDPAPENLLKKKSESATGDRTTKEESGEDNDAMSFMSSIYQDDDEGAEMRNIGGEEKSGSLFQQDNLADFSPSR